MRWVMAVLAALLVVLAASLLGLFIVQNSAQTAALSLELPYPPLRWTFVNPTTGRPPAVLLLVGLGFLGGLGLGGIGVAWQSVRHGRRVRKLRQELALRPGTVARVPSASPKPVTPTKRDEPVTNVATPIRTTANRAPRTEEAEPEATPAAAPDPDTQTRNW